MPLIQVTVLYLHAKADQPCRHRCIPSPFLSLEVPLKYKIAIDTHNLYLIINYLRRKSVLRFFGAIVNSLNATRYNRRVRPEARNIY